MPAQWTFLLYMYADSSLYAYANDCIDQIQALAATSTINVVVQAKIAEPNGTVTATRYVFGSAPEAPQQMNPVPDMGCPDTLAAFLQWASGYPATHTALIFWGHGYGVDPGAAETPAAAFVPHKENLIYDGDSLTIQDVREQVAAWPSGKVDLIGFDACLMGMVEVAYEVREVADAMVASEDLSPRQSWPYRAILSSQSATPAQDAKTLAQAIVSAFQTSYTTTQADIGYAQLSAIQLQPGQIDAVYTAIDTLAKALDAQVLANDYQQITAAMDHASAMYDSDYIDLEGFLEGLGDDLETQVSAVHGALANAIVGETFQNQDTKKNRDLTLNGISIVFPAQVSSLDIYDSLLFGTNAWGTFLKDYLRTAVGAAKPKPTQAARKVALTKRPYAELVHRAAAKAKTKTKPKAKTKPKPKTKTKPARVRRRAVKQARTKP